MISFKGAHFERDLILPCVRCYLAYPPSYRQLEEMMQERGVAVDHSTINRWVLKYAPHLEHTFRTVKRVTCPMLGFKSFHTAQSTLAGVELMHMIKKGQIEGNERLTPAEPFYSLAA